MSFHKTEILGIIGKDAELLTIGQKTYVKFTVAVDNGKDQKGEQRPSTWFDVLYPYNPQTQAWMMPLLVKKARAYVSGRVKASAYISKQNNEAVASLEIWATQCEPLGMRADNGARQVAQAMPTPQQAPQYQALQGFTDEQLARQQIAESNLPF